MLQELGLTVAPTNDVYISAEIIAPNEPVCLMPRGQLMLPVKKIEKQIGLLTRELQKFGLPLFASDKEFSGQTTGLVRDGNNFVIDFPLPREVVHNPELLNIITALSTTLGKTGAAKVR
jgi:hypothetical protein